MASSGNFCTLNPLDCDDAGDLINGNLTLSHTDSAWRTAFGNMGVSSGKWYFESRQVNSASGNGYAIAVQRMSEGLNYKSWTAQGVGGSVGTYGYGYAFYTKGSGDASEKVHNNSYVTTSDITAGVAGDVYQIALDLDNNKVWFGKNNTWHNSGDPANNSNETYCSHPAGTYCSAVCVYTTSSDYFTHNYGQDSTFGGVATAGGNADGNGFGDFAYAPPTGFLAMCSANLSISDDIDPAQTDDDFPGKQFEAIAYTGSGGNNAITGLGFQPDLVWMKRRAANASVSNALVDSSRGRANILWSSRTVAESTNSSSTQDLKSFDSDGFTLGVNENADVNGSSDTYVAWAWRANGGTTASNSNGSITATVQANTAAGFSIATYTSPGSGTNHTVGHGLSGVDFIITKDRDSTFNWYCFHKSVPDNTFRLNSTTANFSYSNWSMGSSTWGSEDGYTHNSTDKFVAYCWQNVEGFQKFGTYVGNGNTDGPFIYTGFRPRFIITKSSTTTSGWNLRDSARSTFNPVNRVSQADTTSAELTSNYDTDFLSNGFKIRASGADSNSNGDTYFYAAWGDVPFKYNNTF